MTDAEFLIAMHRINQLGLKARDIVILYMIIAYPGINGKDLSIKLNLPARSQVQDCLYKLERMGYIIDKRPPEKRRKANPAILEVTGKGLALWKELKPE